MDRAIGIAVDNDPASLSQHDVYVFESSGANIRVQKFTPEGAFVWMVGGKVNKTTEANLCTAASGNEPRKQLSSAGSCSVSEGSAASSSTIPGTVCGSSDARDHSRRRADLAMDNGTSMHGLPASRQPDVESRQGRHPRSPVGRPALDLIGRCAHH